jgi:hypothetical protein
MKDHWSATVAGGGKQVLHVEHTSTAHSDTGITYTSASLASAACSAVGQAMHACSLVAGTNTSATTAPAVMLSHLFKTVPHLNEGVVDCHHPDILAVQCSTQHQATDAAKACKTAAAVQQDTRQGVRQRHVSTRVHKANHEVMWHVNACRMNMARVDGLSWGEHECGGQGRQEGIWLQQVLLEPLLRS